MAGDSAKFIVEFQADVAKLRKEMQGLKKDVADFNKGDKRNKNEQKKYVADESRRTKVDRREKKKDQDQERKHIRLMGREKLTQDRTGSRERIRAMEQEVRAYQRLSKKGPLPAHMDPDGRYSQQQQRQRSRVTGSGLMGAAGAVGLGIGGFLVSAATKGYAQYNEMRVARARSIGLADYSTAAKKGVNPNAGILSGLRNAGGGKLGYSKIDEANMNPIMARATGANNVKELMQGTRASGMEAGEVGGVFGGLRQAGYSFAPQKGGSGGANAFKKLMSGAVQSGLEGARKGEFIDGIMSLVEQQRGMATGKIDATKMAAQLASWGATGKPGLQGAAGASLMGKVSGGITNPGGGEWGSNFMNQAMGFGKPGGTTSYYDAEKMRESAGRDPAVVEKAMKEFSRQFGGFGKGGGKEESALAMRESLGVTLDQAEALQDIYSSTKTSTEKQTEIAKIMEQAQPLEKQSLDAMKGLGGGVKRIADLTNKGIEIGSKAAPLIEKMEDWQHQFLEYLMQMAQDIAYIANYFKDLVADKTGAKGATGDQMTEISKLRKKLVDPNLSEKDRQATMAMIKKREASARAGIEVQAEDLGTVTNSLNPWGTNKGDIMQQVGNLDRESAGSAAQFKRGQQVAAMRKSGMLPKSMDDRALSDFIESGVAPPDMVDAQRGIKQRRHGKMTGPDGGVIKTPDAPPPSQTGNGVGAHSGGPNSSQSTVRVLVEQTSTEARVPAKTQQPQGGGRPAKPSSH